jgi:hypothetical protein
MIINNNLKKKYYFEDKINYVGNEGMRPFMCS